MNRRQAIRASAYLASGAILAPRLLAREPSSKFKIGACDWSIEKGQDLDAFRLGRALGLDGIQFSFGKLDEGIDLRQKEDREALRQVVAETGVEIASLAIGLLNQIPFATDPIGEQLVVDCIETMRTMKSEAESLGDPSLAAKVSPDIVLLAFFGQGDINGRPDLIEKVIEKLKRIAPTAQKAGIVLGLETWLNEADHRHILESVDSPAVKVYYDLANANKMGYDIYREIESLGRENICQIHCKENGFLLGQGRIDFERIKKAIDRIGYDNWLIIESATPKGMEIAKAYRRNVDYLRSVF